MKKALLLLLLIVPILTPPAAGQVELGANAGMDNRGNDYNFSASYKILRHARAGIGYDSPEFNYGINDIAPYYHVHCPYIFLDYVEAVRRHEWYIGFAYNLFDLTEYDYNPNYSYASSFGNNSAIYHDPEAQYTGTGYSMHIGYSYRVGRHFWLNAEYAYHEETYKVTGDITNEHYGYYTLTAGVHYKLDVIKNHRAGAGLHSGSKAMQ